MFGRLERLITGSLLVACACLAAHPGGGASAADLYWDINGTTANGDGAGQWANTLGRITSSATGTSGTSSWSNSANGLKSFQFGFGPTPSNSGTGGVVTVGSSGGTNGPAVGSLVFNASGNGPYTLQNTSTTTSNNVTINTGGADVAAGYGIVVNSNVVGDTTFQLNPAAGSLGSFTVSLGANQTWQNNSSSYALIVNVPIINGTASPQNFSLTTNGVGLIVLGGSNSFTNGLTVAQGTLRATNAYALSSGAVTVNSGATLDVRAAITKNIANSGTVSIGAGGSLSSASLGGTLSLGAATGTATFASTLGSGTLSLAALSATGNTNISLAAGSQIGASGAVTFSGTSNVITLTGAAATPGTYTLVQGSSLTTSGLSLTGAGIGGGTLALGDSSTYGRNTYQFNATATALQLAVTGTVFSLTWDSTIGSGTWNVDGSAAWLQNGAGSPITFFNSDNVTFASAATVATPGAVSAGSLAITNATGSVDITGTGTVGASTLTKSGAGAATIANNLTVASGVTVGGGSLAANGSLGVTAGGLAVTAGSLTTGSTTTITAGGLTVSGGVFTANGATTVTAGGLTVSSGSATLGVASTIAGGITVSGGSLALNAANTVSGTVAVTGGVLSVGAAGALGTGTATINGGTLAAAASGVVLANPIAVGSSGATISNGGAFTLSGAITGSSNVLVKSGAGELTISGAVGGSKAGVQINVSNGSVVFSGASVKELGGTSVFNGGVTINSSTVTLSQSGSIAGTGTLAMIGVSTINVRNASSGGTKAIANPVSLDGTASLAATSGGNLILTGALSGSGAVTTSGAAKVGLTGTAGSFAGSLTVNNSGANGFTEINTAALHNATSVTVNRNASLTGADGDLQITNTAQDEFAAVISGSGILSISAGTNRAILSGANTFGGGANLKGDVGITNASALGTGPIASLGSGARVFWDGTASSVTLANILNTGASPSFVLAFAPGSGKTVGLTGSVSGSGQLKVSSGGDLDLTGLAANTSTGGVEIGTGRIITGFANLGSGTINFGTGTGSFLVAAASGTLSNAVTIGSSSGSGYSANVDTNGYAVTISSAINDRAGNVNGGLLTKLGAGTLTLTASNGYTGATTVSAGTLAAGNPFAFGTGTVTLNGGTLDLASQAVGNPLTIAGGTVINLAQYAGTQTLSTTMSYSGTVGGTLNVAAGGTLKGSGVTFLGPVTIGTDAIHAPGNSPGAETFAAGLTYGGTSTLQWELVANGTNGPGTNYDVVTVTGGMLSIASGAGLQPIFNGAGSAVNWNDPFWNVNHSWTVIDATGAAGSSGVFSLLGDGATWLDANSLSLASAMAGNNRSTSTFAIDGSSGSTILQYQVVLTVPEPGTLILAGLGVAGLAAARCRRRRGG